MSFFIHFSALQSYIILFIFLLSSGPQPTSKSKESSNVIIHHDNGLKPSGIYRCNHVYGHFFAFFVMKVIAK